MSKFKINIVAVRVIRELEADTPEQALEIAAIALDEAPFDDEEIDITARLIHDDGSPGCTIHSVRKV